MRRRLPQGVRMYTGDDFNYAELIAGDDAGLSPTRCSASSTRSRRRRRGAGGACRAGDTRTFHAILAPTVPLSRHIFQAPTRFYKTGVVFMAWLNGHQDHFTMVGGQQSARSILHLAELFRLADAAGLLRSRARRRRACAHVLARTACRRDARPFARPLAAVDQHGDGAARGRSSSSSRAAPAPASPRSRPGATRCRPCGLERAGAAHPRRRADRHRLLPRRHVSRRRRAGRRAALDDNRRAVDEAAALGAPAWCSWSAACRRARATSPRARGRCATARRAPGLRAAGGHAARDRAAASDVRRRPRLREHAGAGARPLRRAGRGRSASRSTSIMSGGIPTCAPDRARRRDASSPTTSATGSCRRATC